MPKSNAQERRDDGARRRAASVDGTGDRSAVARGRSVRTRLLAAATELIGEIGWTAVSTRTLAERAGVGPGLVHYHFDSLQALLRQAAIAEMTRVLDEATAALAHSDDIASGLEALTAELDAYVGDDPSSLLLIEAYLAATRDPQLHAQLAELMLGLRTSISMRLAAAGAPRPEAAAALVLAALDGLVLQRGLDPELRYADVAPLLGDVLRTGTGGTR